ncbi:hypothetical protein GCM10025331_43160 [Actinoplanes utahensis]|nr:hypothetical protein Aut01nite_03070 [Actinoplanes utahensis]
MTTPVTARTVPSPAVRFSDGWEITVYYTAVERFHDGEPVPVTGCPSLVCTSGGRDLGEFPADFVNAVREEGTGLTVSGRYLNWSYDVGFWLDSAPRASDGGVLVPFVSAAADTDVLPAGTAFTIADCGRPEDVTPAVCARLRAAAWRISDEFTPGLGGARHIDAYIGPETGPGFTDSEWFTTLAGARLLLG